MERDLTGPGPGPGLVAALDVLAGAGHVLVASDFDGVLAPIVSDPAASAPLPGAIEVLRALAALPATTVALVSGRARADLARLSGLPGRPASGPTGAGSVHLIGTHGAEIDDGLVLDDAQRTLLARVVAELERVARGLPGVTVEVKPASATLHVRNADRTDAAAALAQARSGPATRPGVEVTEGKEVIELAVLTTSKGTALVTLRDRVGADAVLYLGDDVTDEKAFAVLRPADVGVKVGDGPTAARHRVADPEAALAVLRRVLAGRRRPPRG